MKKFLLSAVACLTVFTGCAALAAEEGIGELWRVFGLRGVRDGVTSVEWKTSLQKTLGRYIADGGVIRGGRFLYLF